MPAALKSREFVNNPAFFVLEFDFGPACLMLKTAASRTNELLFRFLSLFKLGHVPLRISQSETRLLAPVAHLVHTRHNALQKRRNQNAGECKVAEAFKIFLQPLDTPRSI